MNWMLVGFSFQKSEIIFSQSCQEVILSTIAWNLLLNRQEKVFAIHSYNVALVIIYARFRQFRQEYALLNLDQLELRAGMPKRTSATDKGARLRMSLDANEWERWAVWMSFDLMCCIDQLELHAGMLQRTSAAGNEALVRMSLDAWWMQWIGKSPLISHRNLYMIS